MKLTSKEERARNRAWGTKETWFYVDGYHLDAFTSKPGGIHIPMGRLLRALQRAGLLRQWDRKQEILR